MNNKPSHCPSADLLVEFAAGTLGTAESICVSTHLHFCPHCKGTLHRLEQIGSHFMEKNCEAVTKKLKELHPDFVDVVLKENKYGNEFKKRKEVRVKWKEAFKSADKGENKQSILF